MANQDTGKPRFLYQVRRSNFFFSWILYLILFAFLKFNFLRNLIQGTNDEKALL